MFGKGRVLTKPDEKALFTECKEMVLAKLNQKMGEVLKP